jgi:hypothetical protein
MIAEWLMDQNAGDVVTDTSLKRLNGTKENATWVAGRIGNALKFEGNGNVDFGDKAEHDIHATGGTYEIYFKHDGSGGEIQTFIAKGGMKITLNTTTGKIKCEYPCSEENILMEV